MKEINILHMTKKFLLFFLLLSLTSVQAQLLWKITGKNLKSSSYLFGTDHYVDAGFADSIPKIFKCFNNCNTIVGEMTLNSIDNKKKLYNAAIMPQGVTIDKLISEENYKIVDTELKDVLKIGLKDLSVMQPNLILNIYRTEVYKKILGYKGDYQLDSFFQFIGNEKGKEIIGLETAEKQISILFDTTNLKKQAEILVESIVNKKKTIDNMLKLNKLYKSGDLESLLIMAKSQMEVAEKSDSEFTKTVNDRNALWIKQLPFFMKKSSCFITVDAKNLPGETGLIKLLEKSGYKVKPVI